MEELLAQLAEIDKQLDALLEHDDLTEEQRAEHERLVAERAAVMKKIDRQRDRQAREDERATLESQQATRAARTDRPRMGRVSDPDQPAAGSSPPLAPIARPVSLIPPGARRFGNLKHFRGTDRYGRTAEERAYRFGMWCLATISQQVPGQRFPEAERWVNDYMAVHQTTGPTGAGYLVPDEFSMDIIDLREQFGVCRRVFRNEPMTTETKYIPRRTGGLQAYHVSQGQATTESNKTWDQIELIARELAAISRYSGSLSMDAAINIGDDLAGEIAYAFTDKEDDDGFNGDGTSFFGGIQGIRNKFQNVDGQGTASAGLVTQGAGNTWGAMVLADFEALVGLLPQYADTPQASWLCHRSFYYTVMHSLALASGGVPRLEIVEGDRRPRPTFLGYPVDFAQKFPGVSAVSSVACTLGDHTRAAAFGNRQGVEVEFSNSAVIAGESTFERRQIAIRGIERFDINVHDVGGPAPGGEVGPVVALQTGA